LVPKIYIKKITKEVYLTRLKEECKSFFDMDLSFSFKELKINKELLNYINTQNSYNEENSKEITTEKHFLVIKTNESYDHKLTLYKNYREIFFNPIIDNTSNKGLLDSTLECPHTIIDG
jgi:hypothetical protein